MELYCGIDLHSNNSYLVVLEAGGRRHFARRLPNDLGLILAALAPFRTELAGVVVESTYNWYWLVDGLMAAGYRLHLANPAAMKQYEGLKHVDDRSDADWLARSLALGILPEGYIYPAVERPLRDMLRRRCHQVAPAHGQHPERSEPTGPQHRPAAPGGDDQAAGGLGGSPGGACGTAGGRGGLPRAAPLAGGR